jgi:hypothetical protein
MPPAADSCEILVGGGRGGKVPPNDPAGKIVLMSNVTPTVIAVLTVELLPAVVFGFFSERAVHAASKWPAAVRYLAPALLVLPYVVLAASQHILQWRWLVLYSVLPVAMAWLLAQAAVADPEQRGDWRDALILLALGLSVDLRWFDPAWPAGLRGLGNLLLVDAGLYAFLAIRGLSGTGYDFHLLWSDWKVGFRELAFFAPIVIVAGLALGFIKPHANLPSLGKAVLSWVGIFVFVAVPEELFFRAWCRIFWSADLGCDRLSQSHPSCLGCRISTRGI